MKIVGLFLLSLGALLLIVQRVLTAGAPMWVDVTLLVLGGLCVLVALVLAKGAGSNSKELEKTETKKEPGSD
jgi:hypothetical protein